MIRFSHTHTHLPTLFVARLLSCVDLIICAVAVNFVHDDHSRGELAAIARHFNKNVVALPRDDIEKVEEIVAKDLK